MKCSVCKQDLPEDAFNPCDKYRCRECNKARKRAEWDKKHPEKVWMNKKGQWEHRVNRRKRLFWTANMITMLKRYYPTTKNKELAELLGVGVKTLRDKAKELGVSKDSDWFKSIVRSNGFYGYYGREKKRIV